MPKMIPFPFQHVQQSAASLLALTASHEKLKKPQVWVHHDPPPEPLGNMLQRLALRRPVMVLLIESIVAELLKQLGE